MRGGGRTCGAGQQLEAAVAVRGNEAGDRRPRSDGCGGRKGLGGAAVPLRGLPEWADTGVQQQEREGVGESRTARLLNGGDKSWNASFKC